MPRIHWTSNKYFQKFKDVRSEIPQTKDDLPKSSQYLVIEGKLASSSFDLESLLIF